MIGFYNQGEFDSLMNKILESDNEVALDMFSSMIIELRNEFPELFNSSGYDVDYINNGVSFITFENRETGDSVRIQLHPNMHFDILYNEKVIYSMHISDYQIDLISGIIESFIL